MENFIVDSDDDQMMSQGMSHQQVKLRKLKIKLENKFQGNKSLKASRHSVYHSPTKYPKDDVKEVLQEEEVTNKLYSSHMQSLHGLRQETKDKVQCSQGMSRVLMMDHQDIENGKEVLINELMNQSMKHKYNNNDDILISQSFKPAEELLQERLEELEAYRKQLKEENLRKREEERLKKE